MPEKAFVQKDFGPEDKDEELRVFLNQIFQLDQSDPNRTNAVECYGQLKSREGEFIGSSIESAYWNALSLELFHIGQTEAIQNENIIQARQNFTEALEAAKKGFSDEWLAYMEGTLYYLDNNMAGLMQIIDRAKNNIRVLQHFIEGLKERGYPDYKKDY